jgi:hypothetical protein
MTATAEIRFEADGSPRVRSYVRLTASTRIYCCTYEDAAPILTIHDGPADITITNPGRGEATGDDVAFARELADAAARYLAEVERLAAADRAAIPADDESPGRAA